jgi:hypothetical protein
VPGAHATGIADLVRTTSGHGEEKFLPGTDRGIRKSVEVTDAFDGDPRIGSWVDRAGDLPQRVPLSDGDPGRGRTLGLVGGSPQ